MNRVPNHVARGLANRSSAYRIPSTENLMIPLLEEVQALEDVAWQIWLARFLDNEPTGRSLEILGLCVGEERQGSTDAEYLLRIKLKIRATISLGTFPDFSDLMKLVEEESYRISEFPGWVHVTQYAGDSYSSKTLINILRIAKEDGIRVRLVSNEGALPGFTFPSTDDSVTGSNWPSTDGSVAAVADWQGVRMT